MTKLSFITRLPIAHRGLHNADENIVENSKGSVLAAIKHGYAIEIDVQLTKDNQAIVFHDENLQRMVDNDGKVIDFTLQQLLEFKQKANGENLISFKELLEIVDGKVPLIIEVKSIAKNVGPLEKHIADAIQNYKGEICVMSFNPYTVREFKRIAPDIIRGIVALQNMKIKNWPNTTPFKRFIFKNLLHWFLIRPDFISYRVHDLPIISTQIAGFFGIPIITWTVKNPEDAQHSYKYADQITFEKYLP